MTINVDSSKQKIIESVMAFPLEDVLKKYSIQHSIPIEIAREHEREIKRFLALCILNPKSEYGMRGPIDEIWHTFILFTKKYHDFCNNIAGFYIHHFPSVPGDKSSDEKPYLKFLKDYKDTFGEEAPSRYWSSP